MQLFIGKKPEPHLLTPIKNSDWHCKPEGGLWTSSFVNNTSEWIDWKVGENWRTADLVPENFWLLEPEDYRIWTIDSLESLKMLLIGATIKDGSRFNQRINWELLVKEGYDGVRVTSEGQWATRFGQPNLYGWDCESTVWFRWCFKNIQQAENILIPESYGSET